MKLTSKVLDRIIREVISEQKHTPFRSAYDREQHLRQQQKEAEARRQKKRETFPGMEELTKLSKGIMQEGEVIAQPDEDGYVKVKADALKRILTEQNIDVQGTCNKAGYYKLNQILDVLNRLNLAEKGDLNKT